MANMNLPDIIANDLEWFYQSWNTSISDAVLRMGSTALRRLLVHNELQAAWRMVGFEKAPRVVAPRLEAILDAKGGAAVEVAFALGGIIEGLHMGLSVVNRGRTPVRPQENPMEHSFRLHEYVESCSMFLMGRRVRRREIVKYVANKMGGAHFDPKRKKGEEVYGLLDRHLYTLTVKKPEGDEAGPTIAVSLGPQQKKQPGLPVIWCELLCIGQHLASSPDIRGFVEKVRAAGS